MPDNVSHEPTIEDYFTEERVFPPPADFRARAVVDDPAVYDEAAALGPEFWAHQAGALDWFRPWDTVLSWDLPFARWFDGGTLNVSYNCLDRHVAAGRGDKVAFHWEGEPGDTRTISYADLLVEVCRFANILRGLGVARGDRVAVYMPMVPELAVAMLACTRIGAVHSVVFGGFSSDALRDRILDAEARVVVTADGGWRRGQGVALKGNVDAAVSQTPCVDHVVVVRRTGDQTIGGLPDMTDGRDHWWHELMTGRGPGGRRRAARHVRAGADGRRGSPVHPLHLGHHGRPQGDHAHDRRLPDPGRLHPQGRVRPARRRGRLLVRGRHRLGHRAQLHRLRTTGQRCHLGDVRGHPGHIRAATGGGRSSSVTA